MTLTLGSLCTGAGMLERAAREVFGCRTVWLSEIDRDASYLLSRRFKAPNLGDVKNIDWGATERPDIITAGYPCQPFSSAGRRRGKEDPRHIWPWIEEGVQALRPRVVILENVQGHLTNGFGDVIGSLAAMGYDVRWGCVRASDAGAPHRRARVFVVAADATRADERGTELPTVAPPAPSPTEPRERHSTYPWGSYRDAIRRWEQVTRPAPPPVRGGMVAPAFVEWMMGWPEGWVTGLDLPPRTQLRILGNGVVPQQALLALRLLLTHPTPHPLLLAA